MEIANGVHHFDCGPFNWYLIEEEGRLTLVNAGFHNNFIFIWLRSWLIAFVIAFISLLFVAPVIRKKLKL